MNPEVPTLRDYFASAAMQSLLSQLMQEAESPEEVALGLPNVPAHAYAIADLMLKERGL